MFQSDSGDLQVLGAGPWQSMAKMHKGAGGLFIEGEHREFHQQLKAVLELLVAVNLLRAPRFLFANESAPAFGDFLGGDDGEHLGGALEESLLEPRAEHGVMHIFVAGDDRGRRRPASGDEALKNLTRGDPDR